MSEEMRGTKVRAELVRTTCVHLTTSVMRRCAKMLNRSLLSLVKSASARQVQGRSVDRHLRLVIH